MDITAIEGNINVKFLYMGQPDRADFNSTNIKMTLGYFDGHAEKGQPFMLFSVNYGVPLEVGEHTLEVGSSPDVAVRVSAGDGDVGKNTTGIIKVTISENQTKQVGSFDVMYVDHFGRDLQLIGSYEGKFSWK
jgi:hypothetical protein